MNPFPRGANIPKPPDKLVVFPHLEMGDALIVNGMCRTMAKEGRPMIWLTDVKYVFDVRRMYEDLPKVQVLGALGYSDVMTRWKTSIPDAKCLGYSAGGSFNVKKWDESMYHQAGLNFNLRWDAFRLPPSLRLPEPPIKEKVALIHEDRSRGYEVIRQLVPKELKHLVITRRKSFWDWLPEILSSAELHFIDSSFLNLVESLYALGYLQNTKLVWHKYAKTYSDAGPPIMRAPWHIVR